MDYGSLLSKNNIMFFDITLYKSNYDYRIQKYLMLDNNYMKSWYNILGLRYKGGFVWTCDFIYFIPLPLF